MPVARSKSSKSNEEQTCPSTNGREPSEVNLKPGNCKCPRETTQPRRSVRQASRRKYTVPTDKPIVPSRPLLEKEGPLKSFDTYKPVNPSHLSKQPAWPKFEPCRSGPHGNRKLQREYSFVLVDCGTHFEMVSPKTVNHFSRVPQCFGTMAPYHNFGSDVGEEELRKKLRAKIVKREVDGASQKAGGTSQTRKRGRSEDEEEEASAANDVKRPVKKTRVTSTKT